MRLIIVWCALLSLVSALPAEIKGNSADKVKKEPVAVVVKIDGKARLLAEGSIKKRKVQAGERLFAGDSLITYTGSILIVELTDSSKVVLNENAELFLLSGQRLKQNGGEIYYKIKKRSASQGLRVETPFSIIGIKGTEFIVNSKAEGEIALNEGLVGIESLKAEFELHKQKVMAEYEKYKDEQLKGFEEYKASFEGETISYVKAFDLQSGKVLRFSDADNCENDCESRVNEEELSDTMQNRFEFYKAMLNE